MTLIINNDDVTKLLPMKVVIDALEDAYIQLAAKKSVCRPRIDIQIPTDDPSKLYQWGTMEGGSTSGYFAIRMKSDIVYEHEYNGVVTEEKYCTRPGLYCGLILLTDTKTGEPLAFINDGVLQHMRVGADGGIGVKYMAREDSEVVGMLGSGGMARMHMAAFMAVRPSIKKLQVFSPTKENRERFAREMADLYGIDARACDKPDDIYKGADIVAALTDSVVPVLDSNLVEPGSHVVIVGGEGRPTKDLMRKIDVFLRFVDAPSPVGQSDITRDGEFITYAAEPSGESNFRVKRRRNLNRHTLLPDRIVTLNDILAGQRGRTARDQITYSKRGNHIQGNQFWAVAGKVYEAAIANKAGHEIPTEWFLQDIRD